MSTQCYIPKKFAASSLAVIDQANTIIAEYQAKGFRLTLRQLYYQFVARDLIPNKQTEYKRLGGIVNDGRLAGLIDWSAIEDRGRNLIAASTWDNPAEIIQSAAYGYRIDKWVGQDVQLEVWIEKDALSGVIAPKCKERCIPYFACKGYPSQSEVRSAGHFRLRGYIADGKRPVIIHLGDHDPSGLDMTRDIEDRLSLFAEGPVEIIRVALNRPQIDQYQPPPNPAKVTDSRFADYAAEHGSESWELDALEPTVITDLIQDQWDKHVDHGLWRDRLAKEQEERDGLIKITRNYDAVKEFIDGLDD